MEPSTTPDNAPAAAAVHHGPTEEAPRWTRATVEALFELPFNDLLHRAQTVHRLHFDANAVQLSTLLSIKTGGCPEDCAYCPQSARYRTGVDNEPLVPLETVLAAARAAKQNGATRFCMGAAWRGPKRKDIEQVAQRVRAVKALGLETCATLGLLREGQAEELKAAGLDYYNHNLDTAPEFYGEIITTRTYGDRLDTLARVRSAGIKVCCGGIVGMGESRAHPLEGAPKLDWSEFVRTIACARITMPRSTVRLSAGRAEMPEAVQALCFLAGANSIFYGDKLLTTGNPEAARDRALLEKLGLHPA